MPRSKVILIVRLLILPLGIWALWWTINGGASVLVNTIVDAIERPDRTVEGAHAVALREEPECTAWLDEKLESALGDSGPIAALRGQRHVVFHQGIADERLGPEIHSGCFFDGATGTAYFDVSQLGLLDRFSRQAPELSKTYVIARTLAKHQDATLTGDSWDAAAGGLAVRLGFLPDPSKLLQAGPLARAIQPVLGLEANLLKHLPRGWHFPGASDARPALERAEAFAGGAAAAR